MRRGLLGACLLVLLATAARAGEPPAPGLTPGDWALLPLDRLERSALAHEHAAPVERARRLAERIRKLEALRAERKDPDDDGGRRIGAQIADARAQLAPVFEGLLAALDHDDIDARLLARIRGTAPGPLREIRYATAQILARDDLPPAVHARLAHVQPRLEGALLALEGRKREVRVRGSGGGLDAAEVQALVAGLDARMRVLERRWWRLVDYLVPEAVRAASFAQLPSSHQQRETPLQYIFALPGLTASQGVRLRGVLEEVQAQAAPDQALVARGGRALEGDTPAAEARQAVHAATGRLIALQRWARAEARRILTAAQIRAIEAIPPRVRIEDRRATSVQLLAGVSLSPEQSARLAAMRAELADAREAHRRARAEASAGMAEMGPDSPQMAEKQVAMARVAAEANVVQRDFNGRILLELLRPDQVAAWVIDPPAGAR